MKPRLWLITGFEPFSGRRENSSELLLHQCPPTFALGESRIQIEKRLLPVVFDLSVTTLESAIEQLQPEGVVCVGEAATPFVRLERWARVEDCSEAADNHGTIRSQPTERNEKLPSRLDLESIAQSMMKRHIPVEFSDYAGGFVCNHVFFALQKITAIRNCGFVHVPINYRAYFTAETFWKALLENLSRPENPFARRGRDNRNFILWNKF